VNRVKLATKSTYESSDLEVPIPAKEDDLEISVLIEAECGKQAGIGGVVSVEIK